MKKLHHEILEYVYEHDEAGIREICSILNRKHGDHRDFYGLVALLESDYLRFTGPVQLDKNKKLCSYSQACTFQAYSQGEGIQQYLDINLLPQDQDQFLYIGPKAIEYFQNKSESRKAWLLTALLSLLSAVISGLIVSELTVTAIQVVG
ncbi:hypothetical protein [Vibrio navarrensis]|uniref:hypothetical protein n=1 Tax=Vibrio navarrensis TaxID=29495 RepID=UPI001869A123|nr:hypothetical protein [Vibrio navarrensis]MBE4621244.1 hypothetical protein [Vibrio navarrensis]HAS6112233.1 hypothetical protein [Vibrio vulnificus]